MRRFRFIRSAGEWYIDLPDYLAAGGSREDLQMVAGADEVLDQYAQERSTVRLAVDTRPFENADHLELVSSPESFWENGAYYELSSIDGKKLEKTIWLCQVLLFLFKDLPPNLYVRKIIDRP